MTLQDLVTRPTWVCSPDRCWNQSADPGGGEGDAGVQGPARRKGSSLRLRGREGRRCTRRRLVGGDVREPQASFGFQPAWGLRAGGQRAVRILCLVGFQHRAGDAAQALGEEPSGLDFVLWPDCGCFLSLDRSPLCLHLPISLIKFALWTSGRPRRPKLFSKQEAGHARCRGRPRGSRQASRPPPHRIAGVFALLVGEILLQPGMAGLWTPAPKVTAGHGRWGPTCLQTALFPCPQDGPRVPPLWPPAPPGIKHIGES